MPRYDIYSNSEIAPRSSDPRIDSLAGDYRYTDPVITFSFPGIGARWPYQGDPYHANFAPLSAAQQDVFRAAMASWGTVIAKPIVETTDGEYVGDVRPALGSDPGQANYSHTWYPGYIPGGSVIWYGDNLRYSAWAGGTWDYAIVLHEIGHTLGLSHPFDTSTRLSGYEDNRDHTVMSYIGSYSFYPTTPMVLDIQAVQFLYGANMAWHSGNDVYAFDDSIPYHQTLWDGGGNDTIQYNGAHDATIDLVAGSPSRIGLDVIDYSTNGPMDNVWIAYGAVIENAQGGPGNDRLIGNEAANQLVGREGNDTLYSGAGDDTLTGGAGSDQFEFALWGNDSDTITDLTMDDRVCVYSALLSGSASAGDGSTVGRFEVQCAAGAGYTDLYIGTNTTPGPEVVLHLLGSFGANQFVLDGQFIRLSQPVAGTSIGGTAAADALAGTPGNDQIDGGAGLDTLWATFASSGYQVTRGTTGFVVSGPEGVDALTGVERVRFTDNMGIALDIDGHGGQAYRLYQAAFDRAPDLPGLGYQMNDLDRGWSLSWVANNFIASPEFQATYGSVDNTQFITLLYQNVLNRAPDDGGLRFHLNEFAQGESRADMLTHFSESPENQANVIGQIQNGMQFVPLV